MIMMPIIINFEYARTITFARRTTQGITNWSIQMYPGT